MGKRLLLIGDSLIEFCNWQGYFPEETVTSLGRAGETVEGLLARLAGDISGLAPPDFIIIMTGTNNVAMEDHGFLVYYERVIQILARTFPAAKIIVNSLFPFRLPWFDEEIIPRMNDAMREMAETAGLIFLDMHSLFLKGASVTGWPVQYFMEDHVHLSEQGYRLWAETLAGMIQSKSAG